MMRTLGAYIIMNTTLGHDLSQNPIRIIRAPAPPPQYCWDGKRDNIVSRRMIKADNIICVEVACSAAQHIRSEYVDAYEYVPVQLPRELEV